VFLPAKLIRKKVSENQLEMAARKVANALITDDAAVH
jgi:hypothetical protein